MARHTQAFLLLGLGFALAGCDSGEVPTPSERLAQPNGAVAEAEQDRVELSGDGIVIADRNLVFSTDRAVVEEQVTAVLGDPAGRVSNDECGAGPMEFTNFAGGLSLNFQNGIFVGWFFDEPNEAVATSGDVSIGTARAELESGGGFALIEDSTLGEEFSLGEQIGGFLEDGSVSGLYAGTNCFFR